MHIFIIFCIILWLCYNEHMDNNQNFEQQFIQQVKNAPLPAAQPEKNHKDFPVIPTILGAIIILQSIALIILMTNYFSLTNSSDEEAGEIEEETEETEEESPYVYNENNELTAMTATCTAEDGTSLVLTKSKNYEEYDASSSLTGSGTYTITRDSVFSFNKSSGKSRTLFYDGYTLTDGTVFYDCEEAYEDTPED